MHDHFQTPLPWLGSQEEPFSRLFQGKDVGDHISHVDPVMLDPFQGCREVLEIRSIGMGDGYLILPQVPEGDPGLDVGIRGGKKKDRAPWSYRVKGLLYTEGNRGCHNNGVCSPPVIQFSEPSGNIVGSGDRGIGAEFPGKLQPIKVHVRDSDKPRTVHPGCLDMQQSGDSRTDDQY